MRLLPLLFVFACAETLDGAALEAWYTAERVAFVGSCDVVRSGHPAGLFRPHELLELTEAHAGVAVEVDQRRFHPAASSGDLPGVDWRRCYLHGRRGRAGLGGCDNGVIAGVSRRAPAGAVEWLRRSRARASRSRWVCRREVGGSGTTVPPARLERRAGARSKAAILRRGGRVVRAVRRPLPGVVSGASVSRYAGRRRPAAVRPRGPRRGGLSRSSSERVGR